jgi:carbamoyl-phosphate synthase/aspartate carbamoyltransferase/dihydroorotase
MYSLLHIDYFL